MNLEVKTKTTGFGSPAQSYVDKRLDLNDLIIEDPYTTYYFKWAGESKFGIKSGDILVVDRSKDPEIGDLILKNQDSKITLEQFTIKSNNIWGTITWTLSQIKK